MAGTGADLRAFAAVDEVDDPSPLIRALDEGKATPGMHAAHADIMEQMRLDDATAVLDVGCGLGSDAAAMAARLQPGGTVIGLDVSQTMIAEARRRTAGSGDPLAFVAGSALDLPFEDNTFDRCRAQAVLQHVPDAKAVIREISRVLRPGGRVVAFEFDLGTTVIDHPDRDTTRTVFDYIADVALQGWVGRQLPRLYREAGFTDLEVKPHVVFNGYPFFEFTMRRPLAQLVNDGVLGARQAVGWLHELRRLDEEGHHLGGSIGFLVSAVST